MSSQKTISIRAEITTIRRISGRDMKAHERREKVTERVIEHLKTTGVFFSTSAGYFYFEKGEAPRLLAIQEDSVALGALIQDRYGINRAEQREFEHIINGLENEAHLRGLEVDVHLLAHYDTETGNLYMSRFDGWVYRLDGKQIRQVPNGTDSVFFWDDPAWKPYEIDRGQIKHGLLDTLIVNSANFADSDALTISDQQWLFSTWCLCQFFSSLHPTKPLLLICGEKGGGKTLCLRKWLKLLFGAEADVTALERGKQDGFVATICSSCVAVFDNVDERISWLADHLAQLATGVTFKRRKYYTTNQSVEFHPQCFVALTSRTPKFIEGRDNVLDRTLILQTERRKTFAPEQIQLKEIAKNRNLLWTELLRDLNQIVAALKQSDGEASDVSFRMADFAHFALTVARVEGREEEAREILYKMNSRRTEMLLAEEPISICLAKWLDKVENHGRMVASSDLNTALNAIAAQNDTPWPYRNAHALGQRLSHITSNLKEQFRVESNRDSANQWQYRFWPRAEALNPAETQNGVIQPA